MDPSVNILQVTPLIINSKPTNAWCLSDDLMYPCEIGQDSGVTKPNAGEEIVQERASLCVLLENLTVAISVGVTIPLGPLRGLGPKQQALLRVPGGSSSCWAPFAAYTGPLYSHKHADFSFGISCCQEQLRSFNTEKIAGGNFLPTYFFFFSF